ncbi:MAG: HlyD family efflux transporter periplasmic adaptor subunit [Chitinophagaceae bacterium]|nr:HlyD family efflux transporter periplasmic adaptor subunit [Chitinophagaceae bacterium]
MKGYFLFFLFIVMVGWSCKSEKTEGALDEETITITPVTVTAISSEPMAEYIELNATSAFLQKAYVKASTSGYVKTVNAAIGKMIGAGQTAFILKTKEAESIGNTINLLDTSFKFSGIINIRAGTSGYVTELNHQPGDFVQEGEQLAVISDIRSFVFVLNLPYELRPYVINKEYVELLLPDGKSLVAHISSFTPVVDSASQTQNIILTVNDRSLPINLIAKVKIVKNEKTSTVSLPKQSVLSDEIQKNFWVMKLLDSATAVKVPVKTGMETNDRIEILSPIFTGDDRFLLTGNYGLSDTAKVKIIHQ